MSAFRCSIRPISTFVLGLSLYVLSTVLCSSQAADNVTIPKAGWEKLQNAINGVADAMRAISSASASEQAAQASAPPPITSADQPAQDPELPATTSQVYLEGRWVTEWPKDEILVELGRVDDPRYHGGRLS